MIRRAMLTTMLAFFGGLLLAPAQGKAQMILYGITLDHDQLITIDTNTAAGTFQANLATPMAGYGLATSSNNLFTYDQNNELVQELNRNTGAIVNSFDLGANTHQFFGEGDIAMRNDGTGVLATADVSLAQRTPQLLNFNTSPAGNTVLPSGAPTMDGLAFAPNGVLFGLSQAVTDGGASKLYKIDTTTGVATLVGATGVDPSASLGGITFLPDGTMYMVLSDEFNFSHLYTVNTTTGAASLVGNIAGFTDVSGLAFVQVPEPSTLALAGIASAGLAGLWWRGRRRRVA